MKIDNSELEQTLNSESLYLTPKPLFNINNNKNILSNNQKSLNNTDSKNKGGIF